VAISIGILAPVVQYFATSSCEQTFGIERLVRQTSEMSGFYSSASAPKCRNVKNLCKFVV